MALTTRLRQETPDHNKTGGRNLEAAGQSQATAKKQKNGRPQPNVITSSRPPAELRAKLEQKTKKRQQLRVFRRKKKLVQKQAPAEKVPETEKETSQS